MSNTKDVTRKLLGLINTFSEVRRHKTNIYKPAFFSQTNDEHAKKTNGAISFTIALKMPRNKPSPGSESPSQGKL